MTMYKIEKTAYLTNKIAELRKPGVNIVLSSDGVVIAGVNIGIYLSRPAKNRFHVTAICSDERVRTEEKDFPNREVAFTYCAKLIQLDVSGVLNCK